MLSSSPSSIAISSKQSSSSPFQYPQRSLKLSRRNRQCVKVSCEYSCFEVKGINYRPPGTEQNLLNEVNLCIREKSAYCGHFLQLWLDIWTEWKRKNYPLAGLSLPSSGSIYIQRYGNDGKPMQSPELLRPERYFLAQTVLEEVTFGWPRQRGSIELKQQLALRLQAAINSVGLNGIPLDKDPQTLSGGYKRRLALAIQLVQVPDLLLLDEPLAGLDWKARADVVKLLKHLKKEVTLLVVSHDLKELAPLLINHGGWTWGISEGGTSSSVKLGSLVLFSGGYLSIIHHCTELIAHDSLL
ncbi:hypothetical protein Scep_020961 [Stephania cephalantha]|uniref:ABC transporter domain-containing protein n=1 Tax=Stephania cephalantha TaxID=152367 RepID=A0AAP0F836_9MAGN